MKKAFKSVMKFIGSVFFMTAIWTVFGKFSILILLGIIGICLLGLLIIHIIEQKKL